jgi:gamma-glutamyltranspeptidase/glutathione hydrolase
MVATDSQLASEAGLEVLRAGGNAVDAAAAVSFALGVTRPYSTGLGGGGFMIIRFGDGRVVTLDYRETAPAAAQRDMFVTARAANPDGPPPSQLGALAVGVPGTLAGHAKAVAAYGSRPLADLLQPAIRIARAGAPIDDHARGAMREALKDYDAHPSLKTSCAFLYDRYLGGGRPDALGGKWVQPELAGLLETIASRGWRVFYEGEVAAAIASTSHRGGGIITKEDLAAYKVTPREPLLGRYRDYEIITMRPPSSGGVALIESLNILERFPLKATAAREPAAALHLQIEAMKHAFADRARWLADADFANVPVNYLTSKSYAAELAGRIRPDRPIAVAGYGVEQLPDDAGTSHFSIVDRWGTVVVVTETINTSFGSLACVPEWGLILNNEMDDFAAEPGVANAFGLVQSERNAVAPGKKPLSSMTPTIVVKDGRVVLALGASGGPRIISSVLQVIVAVLDEGATLEDAVGRPRPHHQWMPDRVTFDRDPVGGAADALRQMGHEVKVGGGAGVIAAIQATAKGWKGASDPRKGGQPAGY